ncbi:hypothetical protein [Maribellus maritimus]|uniref:hypothetical protein n=1 Tax=Maribellus maritimus TaxID=2870838 RepID=UPI001EEC2ED9|nr:hypothetical protein [Maribellus maritimus]MCG6187119.1 hypothetical protein [Maribellus maritimus]
MKREIKILKVVNCLLKKIFSNKEKTDFYHECEEVLKSTTVENETEVEEYLKNYQATTRWQTV